MGEKAKLIDITGMKFGMLTVVERSEQNTKSREAKWICLCSCGNTTVTRGSKLRNGTVKSCGCLQRIASIEANTTHNHSYSNTYKIWSNMIHRCENPNNRYYYNYGDRGITVCDEWHTFENFLNDMGEKPKGLTLDRMDNDGNYCKDNCEWTTMRSQSNNTRRNVYIEFDGKRQTIAQWARELNIGYDRLYGNIRRGKTIEQILSKSNSN